jgi:hypothetical protein
MPNAPANAVVMPGQGYLFQKLHEITFLFEKKHSFA